MGSSPVLRKTQSARGALARTRTGAAPRWKAAMPSISSRASSDATSMSTAGQFSARRPTFSVGHDAAFLICVSVMPIVGHAPPRPHHCPRENVPGTLPRISGATVVPFANGASNGTIGSKSFCGKRAATNGAVDCPKVTLYFKTFSVIVPPIGNQGRSRPPCPSLRDSLSGN